MTQDKLAHVFAGIAIAAMLLPFGMAISVIGVLAAAIVKEMLWDRMLEKGQAEWMDALMTILGGALYLIWISSV